MAHDCRICNMTLAELDCKLELLKDDIRVCVPKRAYYIFRNEENEKELKRLVQIKEDLTYIKDVFLQDLYRSNINAGRRRKLLSKKIEEFEEKNNTMKLYPENLPGACQLHVLMQSNEKLHTENLKWKKVLEKIKEDYLKVFNVLENDFRMKIIKFSEELSQIMKDKGNRDNIQFFQ